jgi:hypothetical protein
MEGDANVMVRRIIPEAGQDRFRAFSRPTSIFVRAALAAACLIGLLVLSRSLAQAQDGRGAARHACKADYQRLCTGVSPGGGRIIKCLGDNFDKLSDPCKQAVGAQIGK